MPSPFPGMDPYLETRWGTFHASMIGAMMAGLNQALPDDLEAQIEEAVRVEAMAGEEARVYRPDVAVVAVEPTRVSPAGGTAAVADEEVVLQYVRTPVVLRGIRVVDGGGRLITAIELLSPWNKRGGRLNRDYCRKLRGYEAGDTNWIEIDLLRSSRNRLPVRWSAVPPGRRSAYAVVTFRAASDLVTLRPIGLRQRLPTVPVPLRPGEAEAALDLQAAFDRSYADGRFRSIDYTRPPDPPLSAADAAWAAELVRGSR